MAVGRFLPPLLEDQLEAVVGLALSQGMHEDMFDLGTDRTKTNLVSVLYGG